MSALHGSANRGQACAWAELFFATNIVVISCSLAPYGCCVFSGEQVTNISEELLSLTIKVIKQGIKQDNENAGRCAGPYIHSMYFQDSVRVSEEDKELKFSSVMGEESLGGEAAGETCLVEEHAETYTAAAEDKSSSDGTEFSKNLNTYTNECM